ncbi:helix-turn-helix domain-containing protein [Brevibacillus laterosporus]|uniref:helix-turn-helix domain-containing protein n=1 Tax=Brevibacillus laterosporus TaxID=1465 RepID=UPI0035A5EFC9
MNSCTLGQLIHTYRKKCGKSIADIKNETNISEKVLRRLENDLTNHPKLETIEKVAESLVIPYTEIAEKVVPIQRNQECVREILIRVLPEASKKLLTEVVHQYVTLSNDIREGLIEVLSIAKTAKNIDSAEKLYSVLGKHAMNYQENDIMAIAMFEEYLIARDKELSNSYYLGKRLFEVAHFLPEENRVVAYYKVGVHARIIKKYHESNEYLKNIIDNPRSKNKQFQEKAYHAYYNNLITLEKLDEAEFYLEEYGKLFNRYNSPYYKIDKAIIYAKRNQITLAISLLEKYLDDYENHHNTIFVICELMQLYIKTNKIYDARELYRFEATFDKILERNNLRGPFNELYYGLYLRIKGRVEFLLGDIKESVKLLLESMKTFAELGLKQEFLESMKLIYCFNTSQLIGLQAPGKAIMDVNVQLRISELLHVITRAEEKEYLR